MIVVIASGYFDPLHIGHIEYLKKAKELGNKLTVIVNNDKQTEKKKGYVFMPLRERLLIISAIRYVDEAVESIDEDRTVCRTIEKIVKSLSPRPEKIIFAKGGDRTKKEIPEADICKKLGVEIIDGLGKKIQSSSELVGKLKKLKNTC